MENSAQAQQNALNAAYHAYQQQALVVANQQLANQEAQATRRLEPGIVWERTRGNRHRVVIRREAEYVPCYNGLGMMSASLPSGLGISLAGLLG